MENVSFVLVSILGRCIFARFRSARALGEERLLAQAPLAAEVQRAARTWKKKKKTWFAGAIFVPLNVPERLYTYETNHTKTPNYLCQHVWVRDCMEITHISKEHQRN